MNNQKTVLITGANRGIGFAAARAIAARGAKVVLAVRDMARGQEAAAKIRAEYKDADLEVMQLDLAVLASVREFANQYLATGKPLHVLINNAGPINANRTLVLTKDGFEMFFGVNHLGHFLLTNLLLPVLKNSAPAKIITVASVRHTGCKEFDWDNLRGEKSYDQGTFYNRTKLANLWFCYALARRLAGTGVTSVAACPGFVPKTLMVDMKGFQKLLMQVLDRMPFTRNPEDSGDDFARIALDPSFINDNAVFYSYAKIISSSELSYDQSQQEKLWQYSQKLVGL